MLHILFVLLKILLFLLLSVLLLVLVTALLLLLAPVRYRAHLQKEGGAAEKTDRRLDQFQVQANIHWLLHLIHATIDIRGTEVKTRVTIFGYPIVGQKRSQKEKTLQRKRKTQPEDVWNEEEPETEADELFEDLKDYQKEPFEDENIPDDPIFTEEDVSREQPREQNLFSEDEDTSEQLHRFNIVRFFKSVCKAAKDVCLRIRNSFRQIPDRLRNIQESYQKLKTSFAYYRRIWYDEHTEKAKKHCVKEIRYILRHYLPKLQKGQLIFGLDDPALTGQVLGGLCALQGLAGGQMQIEADFEQPRLEGDVVLKGHIRLCHLAKTALSLFFDKNIRVTVKRIRRMQEKPEK